jgi:hypothetical protein
MKVNLKINFFLFMNTFSLLDETTDSEMSNTINGRIPSNDRQVSTITNTDVSRTTSIRSPISNTPGLSSLEQLSFQSTTSVTDNQGHEPQPMQVDEVSTRKSSISPVKAHSSSFNLSFIVPPETPDETVTPPPTKSTGRQTKARQNSSSNSNKKSPAKAKATTAASRQKQTTTNERKGRPPATRSKSSSATSTTVRTRSSNRRNTKTSRYRKRSYSSGSDEDETEEEDDDDTDFMDEVFSCFILKIINNNFHYRMICKMRKEKLVIHLQSKRKHPKMAMIKRRNLNLHQLQFHHYRQLQQHQF